MVDPQGSSSNSADRKVLMFMYLAVILTYQFVTEGVNGMEARVTVPAADGSGDKDDPRRVALDGVMLQIERCYGRGSIQTLGHSGNELRVATDSTG